MLCSRCQKNVAVVFINKFENGKQINEGLCLTCAKELGIKPLEQMMNQMGITEADLDELNTEMGEFLSDMNVSDSMTMPQSFAGDSSKGKEASKEKQEKEKKEKNNKKSMLETYGTNLTQKARNNELDAVVGRQKEIERIVHILNRRTKNNPVLLGEPGVGKTAVAEAIALRIVAEKVPYKLLGYEVYLLDFTALLAGTQFRGQFEARLKSLLNEVKERKNVILVIDELHNIVAAGDAEGAMNAANILKPALARGEIRVIGATTLTEYRKHIEKDSALERRFAPVIIEEPTEEESVEILKGLRPFYENFHRVRLTDEVLEAAVRLSKRYIPDRYLPDKAIDLIDECGSEKNLNNHALNEMQKLNKQLKSIVEEKDSLMGTENEETYQKLADLKIEECRISDRLKELEQEASDVYVTIEDIARVIERWSSIPVTDLTQSDAKKLLDLGDRIKTRLVGQDEAVEEVAKVIRRSRAGLTNKKKPASFIFVGPTGVGKTELVKTLSREIFGSEEAIIRFDMSEYMEKHSVSKLIGSPPGYVGYDDAGMLTEKVRRRPYSIILLDEIEKAHNDIFNILLQVLDDGVLTDSHGKTVHFENTVIIMTSNAGSDYRTASYGFVENESKAVSNKSDTALKELFRPEFLNRIDEIVHFNQLSKENIKGIVDIMIGDLSKELSAKHITVTLTEQAKDYLAGKGYDKRFGARPLRRLIQKEIESELADMYISGKIADYNSISIDAGENGLSFRVA
ncbi:ATP-dependent Clp protease ATP-binding subunit [Acetivibrio sp. MSJd-27]|uniref:ATP-dependent Clp protease ATP-binding subunit n=1 Tax=Acetivibrio sp. MSJd-27 TaxID=2841523 RepID=UPI0015A8B6B3|nr:ATP-dependent Clp protease ATP-binding subunit [Acetivibrio sp. MSJd-27]MBU5449940.1 ATP-dependent Clp protease ATP-binding subunit [Acetivibrio sp. MSJd-27]